MSLSSQRVAYLDRMRALWVAMMVVDHGLQGYAQTFGAFWFFMDTQRSSWCDAGHVWFNALLMPPLFFLAGLWVVPHLKAYGVGPFIKKRFHRLGVPFLVGVVFLVPLMTFPEYHTQVNSYDSYLDFWTGPFIWSALQAGPFWFLAYLLILTTLTAFLSRKAHGTLLALKHLVEWVMKFPFWALATACVFFPLLQGLSDVLWGAPYWISLRGLWDPYGKLIAVQGSRFMLQACYFFLGVGVSQTSALTTLRHHVIAGRTDWKRWALVFIGVSVLYGVISQPYDPEGAHGHRITVAQTLTECDLSAIFLRTSLQPLVCLLATLVGLMVLMRFESRGAHVWDRIVPYAYGMYFVHEMFTVGVHYGLSETNWPLTLKVGIASLGVLVWSWGIARWVLPRIPLLGPIFNKG